MFRIWCGLGFATFLQLVSGQEAVSPAISAAYEASLSALQSCKSLQDVHRMVEAMDTPDWVSVSPSGDKTSRDEAEKQLLGLLSVPVGQRPIPLQEIIYAIESNGHATVVYWVYRMTDQGQVGSMIRDSWIKTQAGWRRSMHEKIFPDRPLKLP